MSKSNELPSIGRQRVIDEQCTRCMIQRIHRQVFRTLSTAIPMPKRKSTNSLVNNTAEPEVCAMCVVDCPVTGAL